MDTEITADGATAPERGHFRRNVGFIASLQNFVLILIMTTGTNNPNGGGPANATLVIGLYLYRQAFVNFNMGYASALAWVLLLLIMLFTVAQFYFAKYWVFYEGDLKEVGA